MLIEADPAQTGLPPPLVMPPGDASQVILMLVRESRNAALVQLASARNGEGTSTIGRDLALAAASMHGLRTLLLAAEPPSPGRADWPRSIYGMPAGLQKAMGAPPVLDVWDVMGARLTLAAPIPGTPPVPGSWPGLLQDLRAGYDLVLLDSPALERAYTAIVLAPHVDATVLVVEAESTRAAQTRALRDRVREVGGVIAGAILNKRRNHLPRAIYDTI